jgi:hypothetical protein
MEIQRGFDNKIQAMEAKLRSVPESDPENAELIDGYIKVLNDYINSGLLQSGLLARQRGRLDTVLRQKLAADPDSKAAYAIAAQNALALRQFEYAADLSRQMREKWPADEIGWIQAFKTAVEEKNCIEKKKLEQEVRKAGVKWSSGGREYVAFITGEAVEAL